MGAKHSTTIVITSTQSTVQPSVTVETFVSSTTVTWTTTYVSTTSTTVPMPISGSLPLLATIIGQQHNETTFAISDCATSSTSCLIHNPITITAGPKTYHFEGRDYWNVLGQLDWSMSQDSLNASNTSTSCAWTIGLYPSAELKNLASSWITTSAQSSATITPPTMKEYPIAFITTSTATSFNTSSSSYTTTSTYSTTTTSDSSSSGDFGSGGGGWASPASMIAPVAIGVLGAVTGAIILVLI